MPQISRPLLIMSPAKLYVIPNWDRDFENARSRAIERCSFLTLPNHFAGKRINRLKRLKNAQELHGAFVEIAQIASQCPIRGVLLDADGPIDATGLADKTGFSKKGFDRALGALSSPAVALLEVYEIEQIDGEWQLPDSVRQWAVDSRSRRMRDDAQERARRSADMRGRAETRSENEASRGNGSAQDRATATGGTGLHRADMRGRAETRKAAHVIEGKGSEGNEEKRNPLPSPKGDSADLIDLEEAKQLLHDLFGREKRHWSKEELDLLCEHTPFDRALWPLIHTWFTLARTKPEHPVWQVTKPKQELTTFLREWNGEIDKMQRHASLFNLTLAPPIKKEDPAHWQAFFRWRYDADCVLPEHFWELDETQRREWERDHEEFERNVLPSLNIIQHAKREGAAA